MAEIIVSAEDVAELVTTLDELNLPEPQRVLLSGLLGLAAEVINNGERTAAVEVTEPVPSFADQFATAFTPGVVRSLDAGGTGAVSFTQSSKITRFAGE
ncbi:hypothetical protein [Kribbella ginsengisoli]|uniref:Uncharacterized protein n=1 Tax=Kribbella ginsengisoli TaxID=363865 RepID=A0ABP6YXZ7_9ACTN